jgi:hypothetical protein
MDRSGVRRIVERNIEDLLHKLGIGHWKIVVEYELPDDPRGRRAACDCLPLTPYNQARIRIDPNEIDDADDLLMKLRHELFHILLSPYRVYRHVQAATIPAGSPADEQEDRLWEYCDEQAVINLERMYQGLTAGPAPPVARKRRR